MAQQNADICTVAISAAASADIVAAVTGKKIVVLGYVVVVTTATTVQFQSGASTDLTGAMPLANNGVISYANSGVPAFITDAGEKLNMVLGGSVATAGHVTYTLED